MNETVVKVAKEVGKVAGGFVAGVGTAIGVPKAVTAIKAKIADKKAAKELAELENNIVEFVPDETQGQ